MADITLGAAPKVLDVTIEVGEGDSARSYSLRPITRSVEQLLNAAEATARDAMNGDELVAAFVETLDILLVPQSGQRKKAGELVSEKWQDGTFALPQIEAFMRQVQEAAAAGRPT